MRNDTLQFVRPADFWEESFLLGNGSIGISVWGGFGSERIQLNHDTFWAGHNKEDAKKISSEKLNFIRSLIAKKNYKEAEKILENLIPGQFTYPYQPMGELIFTHNIDDSAYGEKNYERTLNISNGIYKQNIGEMFQTEGFVSNPDSCAVLRFTSSGSSSYSGRIYYKSPYEGEKEKIYNNSQMIQYKINAPFEIDGFFDDKEPDFSGILGIEGSIILTADTENGKIIFHNDSIEILDSTNFCLYIHTGTNWNNCNPQDEGISILETVLNMTYDELKKRHIDDFNKLFSKNTLTIGTIRGSKTKLPLSIDSQNESIDPNLVETLYNYGKYLLISSSRPNSQPANLQGIWNSLQRPPWWSNYTMNINLEMNYWGASKTGLDSCALPLYDYAMRLMENGKKTAENIYGASGWCAHHQSDLWAQTHARGRSENQAIEGNTEYSIWPFSGIWISLMSWEHFLDTQDLQFLKDRAHPLLEGSIKFLKDFLIETDEGKLTSSPSTSPENRFDWKGERLAISSGSTMDLSLALESISAFIEMNNYIECDHDCLNWCTVAKEKLNPFRIGRLGQLQEWSDDVDPQFGEHRHQSHLYSIYPGSLLMKKDMDKFKESAKRSLEMRTLDSTGWSTVWKIALNARFGEKQNIIPLLKKHINPVSPLSKEVHFSGSGSYPNLLCAHPPFQIDGNLGIVGALLEIFVQQIDNCITLLPALPDEWKDGSIRGYHLRGSSIIDFHWAEGMIDYIIITGGQESEWEIVCNNIKTQFILEKNEVIELDNQLCRIK